MREDVKNGGIKAKDGKDVFSLQMNANTPLSDEQERWMQGILADMVLYGVPLCSGWGGPGVERYGGVTTLTDVKTLAPGQVYKADVPLGPGPGQYGSVVAKRQEKVHKEYEAHAQKLDRSKGTPVGTKGPMETRLADFGREGKVVGLVMGAYGELSQGVHELIDLIATKRANDYCTNHLMTISRAKNMFKQVIRRKWGLFAHRGWANLLLQRSYGVGRPEHQPANGSFESETQMDMEYHYLHPGGGFNPV
jgi:hypothetical protein